jgi:hypothetical protein
MLEFTTGAQADHTAYPTSGVRIGINYHDQTLGKHRPRFSFDREVADVLRRGLHYPALQVEGTFVNGLRIWCSEGEGMKPTVSTAGNWSFSVPVRRVRGREDHVATMDVAFSWDRDETGPVLIIPRLPDALLPQPVLDKLPNSQVDMDTIMARADKRFQRELQAERDRVEQDNAQAWAEVDSFRQVVQDVKDEATATPEPGEVVSQPEQPETIPGEALQAAEPPSAPALDLKEALAMVNELVDQLGESVVLSIDAKGHVQAKRRIVSYIDL